MAQLDYGAALARVEINGQIAGAAFLVTKRHLLTCAHVVGSRGTRVNLRFLMGPEDQQAARVHWRGDPDQMDVAVLELEQTRPQEVEPVPLAAWTPDDKFRTTGFPEDRRDGDPVQGTLRGLTLDKVVRLETQGARAITKHFSGAPVWSAAQNAVVGMVDAFYEKDPTANMIPAQRLCEAWPELTIEVPYRAKLPPRDFFVHRREFDEVRDLLARAAGSTVGITTALRGAGGFGKSALARALCDDPEVRQAYPDGILWTTMGEKLSDADRVDRVLNLVRWWTDEEPPGFTLPGDAGDYLRKVLAGRRVLLVIDDVWHSADLEPFRGLEPGTVLATTRNARTLPRDTLRIDVDAMATSEAVALLARDLPPVAEGRLGALAARLGEWPLLLRLVGSQLRKLVLRRELDVTTALDRVDARLSKAGLHAFDRRDATERGEAASLTIQLSLDALSADDRRRFLDLAVFPEDVDIPLGVLKRFWELEDWETEELCDHFEDASLLVELTRESIRLHDIVRRYLVDEHYDLPLAHRKLLKICRPQGERWSDLAGSETYLWRHLAWHLSGAGEHAELQRLLGEYEWLEAKLRVSDLQSLLTDYEKLPPSDPLRLVGQVMRLAAHILGGAPGELRSQLWGRLPRAADFAELLQEIGRPGRGAWLRMASPTLLQAGRGLLRTLEGHTDRVSCVAALSDGRIVSGAGDNTLRIWDADSGEALVTLEGFSGEPMCLAVLPDDKILSGHFDGVLRVWDPESREILLTFEGHTGIVDSVCVLPHGRIVSAGGDSLRVWDSENGEVLEILEEHTDATKGLLALADGRVVSGKIDEVRVWDVDSRTVKPHPRAHVCGAALPDDQVVSYTYRSLEIWDTDSGATVRTLASDSFLVHSVAVLQDGRVVSGTEEGTLQLWHTESDEMSTVLRGHTAPVLAVAVLPDGRIVSGSDDHTVRIWETENRHAETTKLTVGGIAVLPDGRFVSGSVDGTLRVWEVEDDESVNTLVSLGFGWVQSLASLSDGRVVSAANMPLNFSNPMRIWNPDTGKIEASVEDDANAVTCLAVLRDDRIVMAQYGSLRVWNPDTGETEATLEGHPHGVSQLAVLPDGRIVSAAAVPPPPPPDTDVVYESDDTLRVWNPDTGEAEVVLEHPRGISCFVVLPDGRIVSGTRDGTLRVWDPDVGRVERVLQGHSAPVSQVSTMPEDRIVSGSTDNSIRVWDLADGRLVATYKGSGTWGGRLAVLPSGQVAAVWSSKTLVVWNPENDATVRLTYDAPIRALCVRQDGLMAVGDELGAMHFVRLDPGL